MSNLNNLPQKSGEYVVKVKFGKDGIDDFYMVCFFNKDKGKFYIEAQSSNDGNNDYFHREILLPVIEWHETPKANLSFQESVRPLMKWLSKNKHPHHTVVVTSTNAELVEGVCSYVTDDFLVD